MRNDQMSFGDMGLVALDRQELTDIRGGVSPWLVALVSGATVAIVDNVDAFIDGVKEGYAWARAGD